MAGISLLWLRSWFGSSTNIAEAVAMADARTGPVSPQEVHNVGPCRDGYQANATQRQRPQDFPPTPVAASDEVIRKLLWILPTFIDSEEKAVLARKTLDEVLSHAIYKENSQGIDGIRGKAREGAANAKDNKGDPYEESAKMPGKHSSTSGHSRRQKPQHRATMPTTLDPFALSKCSTPVLTLLIGEVEIMEGARENTVGKLIYCLAQRCRTSVDVCVGRENRRYNVSLYGNDGLRNVLQNAWNKTSFPGNQWSSEKAREFLEKGLRRFVVVNMAQFPELCLCDTTGWNL